nr:30S ribosomal protein S9 [Rhipidosiphon lewmanomontiae]
MKYFGIGRHKSAIAKVFITKTEINTIIINNKTIFDYFQNDKDAIDSIQQFLTFDDIDIPPLNIKIQVSGGGNTGQRKAICLALARTFYQMGMGFPDILKKKKLLTQDSRIKERKKYGLKKARKAPQYSKR